MGKWSITPDENFDNSVRKIFDELVTTYSISSFSLIRTSGIEKRSEEFDKFIEAVANLYEGSYKEETFKKMTGGHSASQRSYYELRLPGIPYRAYFEMDFETQTGKALLVVTEPVSDQMVEVLDRLRHLK